MNRLSLLAFALLLPLPGGRAGEPPAYDATLRRRWLENMAQANGWPMTYKEDDDLVVAGTCDAKILEDSYAIARQAVDKTASLLKMDAKDLQWQSKLFLVYLSKKSEYMTYAQDRAKERQDESLVKIADITPSTGPFLCLDPSYGIAETTRRHMTAHNLGHLVLGNYALHRGGAPIPGWIFEGFAAWLDSSILVSPGTSCASKVGYLESQLEKRAVGASWDHTTFEVLKDYQAGKTDPKTGKPAYTRLGNLMGTKISNLSGPDVAVSWCLMKELTKKPGEFKTFLDDVLAGTKQADAFQTAFKKSVDDYEKDWIKAFLKNPPAAPKEKRP